MSIDKHTHASLNGASSMQAELIRVDGRGEPFVAEHTDVYTLNHELHVWGIQGDPDAQHDLILLRIPQDTPDGDHPVVSEHAVGIKAVFATTEGAGYATAGYVRGLRWDRAANTLVAEFSFEGSLAAEGTKAYKVENGKVSAQWQALNKTLEKPSEVNAAINPPVFSGADKFVADEIVFVPVGREYKLQAYQNINQSGQGVVLFIPEDFQDGQPAKRCRAFFVVNNGLVIGRNLQLMAVAWNRDERTFKADFAFEFTRGGAVHKVQLGRVSLSY